MTKPKLGFIGIGDMGGPMAGRLLDAGFSLVIHDVRESAMAPLGQRGAGIATSPKEVADAVETIIVSLPTPDVVRHVALGSDGIIHGSQVRNYIDLSTTGAVMAKEVAAGLNAADIACLDSPVSGGFPGAQGGTLTMMAAGNDDVLARCRPIMAAVGQNIYKVGDEFGMGQTVKACLQSIMGSIVTATTEAAALAAKAGVNGEAFHQVLSTSSAGCGLANTALENIIDRKFEKTGSHIRTMYKDLTISMDMARDLGVPIHTAAAAMQLFQAGITKYPDGDNWAVTRLTEEIAGAELHRKAGGKP